MNMLDKKEAFQDTSNLLKTLGHPVRLRILKEIGNGEACVCHLEAQLEIRQAYLSQHLMGLREAGILESRREGRFIYYRVANTHILEIIDSIAQMAGDNMHIPAQANRKCDCPKCCPD